MTSTAARLQPREPAVDRFAVQWRSAVASHRGAFRRAARTLRAASWLALPGAVAGLALLSGARQMLTALAWTLFLLWQFFVLARSKTLTWQTCGIFFVLGAFAVAPAAALVSVLPYWVFDTGPGSVWIDAGWIPILEEVAKVAPLVIFASSHRARTLSLADLGLAGAAVGAGFAFAEESLRRLATIADGAQALAVQPHWQLIALLPGAAVEPVTGRVFAGHAVLTALVGLGTGLAIRYRARDGRPLQILPAMLLIFAILDHMAFAAGPSLPGPLAWIHAVLGGGRLTAPLVLALLACVTFVDLRDLNRLSKQLPTLPGENGFSPVVELRLLSRVAPRGLPGIASLLAFLRTRRRVGFGLRLRRDQQDPSLRALSARVAGHRRRLGTLLAALLGVQVLLAIMSLPAGGPLGGRAAIAVFAVEAGPWWQGLVWYQKLAVAGTMAALGGIGLGGWTAGAGVALVTRDTEDRAGLTSWHADLGGTLRRWLREGTPTQLFAYGLAQIVDVAVRRVPPDDPLRQAARQWPEGWLPTRIDAYGIFIGRLVTVGPHRFAPIGFSHRGSMDVLKRSRTVDGTATSPDERGVYQAVVEVFHPPSSKWIRRDEPSGFFPDSWSRLRVLSEISSALETAEIDGRYWCGTSATGLVVEGRVDPDGTVRSAHPRPLPRALPASTGQALPAVTGQG